jgi:outer membrane protein OmpA-like peptidoglycan-associated protein
MFPPSVPARRRAVHAPPGPVGRLFLALAALTTLAASADPLSAAQPARVGGRDSVPRTLVATSDTGESDAPVTALDVYRACRRARRIEPDTAPIATFCLRFQLPTLRRARLAADWATGWVGTAVPSRTAIHRYAGDEASEAAEAAAAADRVRLYVGDGRFEFQPGSAVLDGADSVRAARLAALVAGHPNLRLLIDGYADAAGNKADDAYNRKLAALRALAVQGALVAAGVPPERLSARSFAADSAGVHARREGGRTQRKVLVAVVGADAPTVAVPAVAGVVPGASPAVLMMVGSAGGDAGVVAAAVAAPRAAARAPVDASAILLGLTDFVLAKTNAQLQAFAVGEFSRRVCQPVSDPARQGMRDEAAALRSEADAAVSVGRELAAAKRARAVAFMLDALADSADAGAGAEGRGRWKDSLHAAAAQYDSQAKEQAPAYADVARALSMRAKRLASLADSAADTTGTQPVDSLRYWRTYLGETCRLFDPEALAAYRPGVASLRTAIRRDLGAMPRRTLRLALQRAAGADTVRVAALLLGARVLEEVERGTDPVLLVARAATWADVLAVRSSGAAPLRRDLVRMADLVVAVERAKEELPPAWTGGAAVAADSVLPYAVRAFVMNQTDDEFRADLPRQIGPLWTHLLDVYQAAAAIDSARAGIARVARGGGPAPEAADRAAAAAARLGAVAARYGDLAGHAAALVEAAALWNPRLVPDDARDRIRALTDLTREMAVAVASERHVDAAFTLLRVLDEATPVRDASARERHRAMLRAVAFAGDVAQAQDAAGVEQALQRLSSPYAGVRLKRARTGGRFAFLNAYAGAAAGREVLGGGPAAAYGSPALPVGVELGLACREPPRRQRVCLGRGLGSFSLFVPVLDLGAVAATRLRGSDEVKSTQSVTLSQVVTPGLYAMWGLRSTRFPLSVGAGATRVANARERRDGGGPVDAWRYGLLVGLDVPLFP